MYNCIYIYIIEWYSTPGAIKPFDWFVHGLEMVLLQPFDKKVYQTFYNGFRKQPFDNKVYPTFYNGFEKDVFLKLL